MGCELRRQLREPGAFCVASMADCLWLRGHDGRPFFFVYQALCVSGVCVSLRLGLKLRRLSVAAAAAAALVPVLPLRRVAGWMGALSPLGGSGAARSWLPVVVVRSFVRSFVAKHCCNRVARAAAGGGRRADARSRGGGGGGGGAASVVVLRTDVVVIAGREAVVVFTRPTRHKLHRTTGGLWCVRYVPPAFGAGALS